MRYMHIETVTHMGEPKAKPLKVYELLTHDKSMIKHRFSLQKRKGREKEVPASCIAIQIQNDIERGSG